MKLHDGWWRATPVFDDEHLVSALPDPYGRYKDGSWPVPPPDGELPQAYLDFADLLLRTTHDGFLFGDR